MEVMNLVGHRSNDEPFAINLINFIDKELEAHEKLSYNTPKERYLIHKQAFDKLVAHLQTYSSLLLRIKNEYELCIEYLEDKRFKRVLEQHNANKLESYAETLKNLETKKNELLKKLESMKEVHIRLGEELNEIVEKNEPFRPKQESKYSFLNKEVANKQEEKFRMIPGLNIEKATDYKYLCEILDEIKIRADNYEKSKSKNFCAKLQKQDLKTQLLAKMSKRDTLQQDASVIRNKIGLYKLALLSAKEYYEGTTRYLSIQEAFSKTFIKTLLNRHHEWETESVDDSLESETERILDYIEKFNDLFENKRYNEAAYYAVTSPKNILRNMEILNRFKTASEQADFTDQNDPLLIYCNALIDSIDESSKVSKPNELMSLECVRIALKYNRFDYLTRWVAQQKLTFSLQAANLIEDYVIQNPKRSKNSSELVHFIYEQLNKSSILHS